SSAGGRSARCRAAPGGPRRPASSAHPAPDRPARRSGTRPDSIHPSIHDRSPAHSLHSSHLSYSTPSLLPFFPSQILQITRSCTDSSGSDGFRVEEQQQSGGSPMLSLSLKQSLKQSLGAVTS